jgi:hypothetical protein
MNVSGETRFWLFVGLLNVVYLFALWIRDRKNRSGGASKGRKAQPSMKELAQLGRAQEIYNLGRMRLGDLSRIANCTEAAGYFREAADQGLASAQFELAKLYFEGNGVPKSYITGARWLRTAAKGWGSNTDAVRLLELIDELQMVRRRERKLRWEVLGLQPGASRAKIAKAYALKAQLFEPDNVQNLPTELRDFANRISAEVRKAYDELMSANSVKKGA